MTEAPATITLGAALAASALPAEAASIGVATGQTARVMNSTAETRRCNHASIAHV